MRPFTRPLDMRYETHSKSFKIIEPTHKVPISCMFLCQFDMKRGNVVIWSKISPLSSDLDLTNVEFKALPSGISDIDQDTVNFVIPKGDGTDDFYYGLASYQQNAKRLAEHSKHIDRSEVQMYSLGVIVDPNFRQKGISQSRYYDWKPNQFVSANEYIDDLSKLLSHWLKMGDLQVYKQFEEYFESNCLKRDSGCLSSPVLQRNWQNAGKFIDDNTEPAKHPHMLESLTQWVNYLGPLMFPLWKLCLLRERVLILGGSGVTFDKCNSLTYCLSILSLIPRIIQNNIHDEPLQPLYTVGLTDTGYLTDIVSRAIGGEEESYNIGGYIACTTDEILTYKPELFDALLKIHGANSFPELTASDGSQIKATPHEMEMYEHLVHTKLGYQLSHDEVEKLMNLVEPLTWSQYLIDGFYWWATAGYMRPSFHETEEEVLGEIDRENLEVVLSLVGYFHEKTCTLFRKLQEVVESSDEEEIVLSPAFLSSVGLDCFSSQDYTFVEKLGLKWFNRSIQVKRIDLNILC
ncbi:LAFE_0H15368g1_1 [Lachancea fermentati]|uniref:LAFE_0H15368g1_1 n=1 Tax=Lachancea fermentati TaxID=4955 RepID=A0A1G4MKW7_LACFM|nr:LAFE_0H15368g1_1 [Lachancea fermentati]